MRIEEYNGVESILNEISSVGLSRNNEMVTCLSYPVGDGVQDYYSDLLPETSCVTADGELSKDSFVSGDKASSCDRAQGRTSGPSIGYGVSSISNNISSHKDARFGNWDWGRDALDDSTSMKMQKQNIETSRQPVAKDLKESFVTKRTDNLCQEISVTDEKAPVQINTANSSKGVPDGERSVEPMVDSSSVGSGISADRVSCEETHNSNGKFCDIEESECHIDVGVKKPASARGSSGSKRRRTAEVHNLVEKRRGDRTNEKMHALQELIPNCNETLPPGPIRSIQHIYEHIGLKQLNIRSFNKAILVNKASMLDEAIEYLKNLQLQVQIMTMGARLCMPPMMLSMGTQPMHPAHLPHNSPKGMSTGILDMNGGSPQYPVFPGPPMQGSHVPSSALGAANVHGIPDFDLPVYGHPSQELDGSEPEAPMVHVWMASSDFIHGFKSL
ncbi:hypothetical protein CDL12_19717 [Handroanthus impetiginosus]|uniref:BHLH domain-containing protein n=1 Tax=Handroanthus impetiginosus TaxID=429701 RepID=A0A2G9GQZ6_9LAMI|nr:hypothetical protein CDL12_19717 [Handroanthus impetiginosus]